MRHLRRQVAAITPQHDAGHRRQQDAISVRHAVEAKEIDPAGTIVPTRPSGFLDERGQIVLCFVEIFNGMLVENDHICRQSFEAPVFLREQQLPHHRQRLSIRDVHEGDRQVAGDPVGPQRRLSERVPRQIVRTGARRVAAKDARCQPIEQDRVIIRQPQMLQRDVHMGEGHREGA